MRFLAAFLLLFGSAFGQTRLTGLNVQNGQTVTLTKAQSPYTIESQINIGSGTLVVEAGVEIIFTKTGSKFNLQSGKLSNLFIQGTALEPVLVRSNGVQIQGIAAIGTGATDRSIIRVANCVFTNLGYRPFALDLRNADVVIQSCLLDVIRSPLDTTTFVGVWCGTSVGIISDVEIRNSRIGVRLEQSSILLDQVDIIGSTTPIEAPNRNIQISVQGQ